MLNQLGAGDPTPGEECLQRVSNLKDLMAREGIAFCLIMQNADLFYFAGSVQKGVLVVPLEGAPLFFVQRSVDRAQAESPFRVIGIGSDKEIGRQLKDEGAFKGKGGMELDVVPAALYERFKGITGCDDFADISGIVKALRMVKSPFELEQIRRSGDLCDRVFARAREIIREGMREIDVDAALVAEGRRFGHQGLLRMRGFNQEMMNLYVTTGYAGTVPSAGDVPVSGLGLTPAMAQGSSLKAVERGVPIIVDYGGAYNGYITDETRSYVVGELHDMFRKPYDCARQIVEETQAFARAGMDTTEVFLRARDLAKRAHLTDYFMGYGPTRVRFIGHGLGIEINELPVITARHHTILEEGMVFAFEPKFIFPGKGAIGVEVDFIVRKDGLERVTETPIDLVVL
jgi:Xaa-Pro aminopeptidase